MKATTLAAKVASKVRVPFWIGQPVRVCSGILAGISGTLVELPVSERVSIQLQRGVLLEIDQSCSESEYPE